MNNKEYYKELITNNKSLHPNISESVKEYVNKLFEDNIIEKQLTPAEIRTIAQDLLDKLDIEIEGN